MYHNLSLSRIYTSTRIIRERVIILGDDSLLYTTAISSHAGQRREAGLNFEQRHNRIKGHKWSCDCFSWYARNGGGSIRHVLLAALVNNTPSPSPSGFYTRKIKLVRRVALTQMNKYMLKARNSPPRPYFVHYYYLAAFNVLLSFVYYSRRWK